MTLGDLGADIIKVEQPGRGDETRTWGPPFKHGETTYFLGLNRNKKSVVVDLRSEGGQQFMHDLVAKSDVLVENYVPGKLQGFNLGYEHCRDINPRLIYASLSAYGSSGLFCARQCQSIRHKTSSQVRTPSREPMMSSSRRSEA